MAIELSWRDFIQVWHTMKGIENCKRTFIEALDITAESDKMFPKEAVAAAVANALHHNGIIREPTIIEVALLDSKIMSDQGRNYRMMDIIDSIATMYMARELYPRTDVEVRNQHNVVLFKPAS